MEITFADIFNVVSLLLGGGGLAESGVKAEIVVQS